ncbi:MAG TPA: ATP-binding protein [Aggregicoccus sp.]|nr:ATP-binding protein [Aggregicoccus sp.]
MTAQDPQQRTQGEEGSGNGVGRERFLEAVVAVQQTLLRGLSLQESDERVVQLLGETGGVSRVYLFEAHPHPEDGRTVVTMRAEWCAPGVSAELHNPEMVNLDLAAQMPLFWRHLSRGEHVASAVAHLPPEERAILEPQGIRSIVVLPLMVGGRFGGLVGFDDCESSRVWDASRVAVLAAAAAGLSLARERHAAEQASARLQERLLLADRMACMGTLAAGVAHEINNPLTYVLSNVELVQQRLARAGSDPAALRELCTGALDEAREGAERVRRIVRQLRLFTRVEEEGVAPVSARAVLELAVAMAGPELRHRARLRWELPQVPAVMAEEGRLGQVLLNLVVNAAQAIPEGNVEGNEIFLFTARAPDGRVVIGVRDSGAGIPPEVLPRIFDPFFTTKPVGRGTGLGLSISHSLVAGMGGEIQVESSPGQGTTFRVLLPAAPAVIRDRPAGAARGPLPTPPPRRLRILVVDDEPGVARALERLLDEHEVVVAHGGEPARALLLVHADWDLVLCDLMMPDLNGMELYAWALEQRPRLAARFVFLTGGAFTDRARAFADQMAGRLLHKPFSADAVRALLGPGPRR